MTACPISPDWKAWLPFCFLRSARSASTASCCVRGQSDLEFSIYRSISTYVELILGVRLPVLSLGGRILVLEADNALGEQVTVDPASDELMVGVVGIGVLLADLLESDLSIR